MANPPIFSSTKEKTNYARVSRLLVDGATQTARKLFDTFHPPTALHAELSKPAVHNILAQLQKKKILNPTQWGNLYPAIPASVTSANFDISLLCILLRNICTLTPPVSGWDTMPAAGDMSSEANLVRIRLYRNAVYAHAKNAAITDADFETYWSEISEAVVRLGGKAFEPAVKNLKHECMDTDYKEHYVALLKQWCENECSVKEKLDNISEQIKNLLTHVKTKMVCHEGTQTEGDPSVVVDHLTEYYSRKASWIQPLPWCSTFQQPLEQIYTKLRIISRERTNSQLTDESVGMYEVFKPHSHCNDPRKVLIEGSQGIGKTTYCQKIAYDWAKGDLAVQESFPHFKQVIFLKCRDFGKEDDLWKVVDKRLMPDDVDDAVKTSFVDDVQKNQDVTLVILDGLDEVDERLMDPISQLIKGKLLSKCYLIVTARHEIGMKVRHQFDTLLEITGYTLEDVREYIKKYFQQETEVAGRLIKGVLESEELSEIARNPMNTALLCMLFEELEGCLPRTRTQLYSLITECMLKRHAAKHDVATKSADIMVKYRDRLMVLGEFAFEAMLKDRLDFDESEVLAAKDIANLGFLSKEINRSRVNPSCRYVFLHKSFQEYLAAFYLIEQLKAGNMEFEETLGNICSQVDKLWQVLVFSAGMLEDDAQRYLETLTKHLKSNAEKEKTHHKLCVVLECLVENENGDAIAPHIALHFPRKLNLRRSLQYDRKYAQLRGLSYIICSVSTTLPFAKNTSNDSGKETKDSCQDPQQINVELTMAILTWLDLSLNVLTDKDLDLLTSSLQQNTTIEVLTLSFNALGDDDLYSIANMLTCNSFLHTLNLSWNKIRLDGLVAVFNALHSNTTLSVLSIRGNTIYSGPLFRIHSSERNKICQTAAESCEGLRCINLSSCRIYSNLADFGLLRLPSLTRLELSQNNLSIDISHFTDASILCTLEYLNFSDSCQGVQNAYELSKFLETNTVLKELNLSNNTRIGYKGACRLAEALQTNNTLVTLDLSNIGMDEQQREEIASKSERIKV